MPNNPIALFEFNQNKIRTVIIDSDVWFVASDICQVLDISNSRDAVSTLSEFMKKTFNRSDFSTVGLTDTAQNVQFITFISEAGMYKLTFKSRKPEAEKFSDWIVSEVIPTIRKTGSYGKTPNQLSPMMARYQLNAQVNSKLGYWSMLNKMNELFAIPLEIFGYTLPNTIVPDISTGKLFCNHLRSFGVDPESIVQKYTHTYSDGRKIDGVNQYPDQYYPVFTKWLQDVWIAQRVTEYLCTRAGVECLPPLYTAFPNQIKYIPKKYLEVFNPKTKVLSLNFNDILEQQKSKRIK